MLAVLIIIGVMGIGLPMALWLVARWRKSVPEKPPRVSGEVNKWLLSEYGLGSRDRSVVQEAVLGRYAAVTVLDQPPRRPTPAPTSLRPELLEAAYGLAARVAADRFRMLRVARRTGWVQLATCAVAVVYGVCVLAAGWDNPFFGAYAVLQASLFVPAGVYGALIILRRRRHNAQNYLAMARPGEPGATIGIGRPAGPT